MKAHELGAEARTVTGRKVKQIRNQGSVPATVYGKGVESKSITVAHDAFMRVYAETGETGLINLQLQGGSVPVLIHTVQRNPVSGELLHVEFRQVNLKEKVKAMVPVVTVNEAPAVANKTGALLVLLSEIEVEALPADLPEKIDADISSLSELDQEIHVSDLAVPASVGILTEGTIVVAKIASIVSKEAEEQAASDAAAQATTEGETATGEGGEQTASDSPAADEAKGGSEES